MDDTANIEPESIEELRPLILSAAGQASAAAFDLIEHYRDTAEDALMSRFSNETAELLADALKSTVIVEIAGLDRAIASAETVGGKRSSEMLREHRAHYNQLLGALDRFVDGWAG